MYTCGRPGTRGSRKRDKADGDGEVLVLLQLQTLRVRVEEMLTFIQADRKVLTLLPQVVQLPVSAACTSSLMPHALVDEGRMHW
jgi:hypothetical protein